jgi:RNA polymerase sigma factor (sigma-70 family)
MGDRDAYSAQLQVWLNRLKEGDRTARARIIDHCCDRLRLLVRRMMKDYRRLERWEQVEDVLQDTLLRVHRSLEQVQPTSVAEFFGLAATQTRRTLIDLARRYFGPEGPGAYPHRDIHAQDVVSLGGRTSFGQWADFYDALDCLPADERSIVDLLWFEGFTQAETSLALGISERTVRRRWFSARDSLHQALSGARHG